MRKRLESFGYSTVDPSTGVIEYYDVNGNPIWVGGFDRYDRYWPKTGSSGGRW